MAGSLLVDDLNKILADIGFKDITIFLEHVYTKDVIQSLLGSDAKINASDLDLLDGAFGSAVIKAVK